MAKSQTLTNFAAIAAIAVVLLGWWSEPQERDIQTLKVAQAASSDWRKAHNGEHKADAKELAEVQSELAVLKNDNAWIIKALGGDPVAVRAEHRATVPAEPTPP